MNLFSSHERFMEEVMESRTLSMELFLYDPEAAAAYIEQDYDDYYDD